MVVLSIMGIKGNLELAKECDKYICSVALTEVRF